MSKAGETVVLPITAAFCSNKEVECYLKHVCFKDLGAYSENKPDMNAGGSQCGKLLLRLKKKADGWNFPMNLRDCGFLLIALS